MRCKSAVFAVIFALTLIGVPVFAQVQSESDVVTPTPQFQDHGGVTPWFWIGLQTVFGAGYNLETGAGGFRNYGGDNYTYASFNLAFVDSHYQTPKFYEVPKEMDPNAWSGHFVLMNFTSRLNSWSGDTQVENNVPAWLAEISGKGARIGFFTQAGELIGGVDDTERTGMSNSNPRVRIVGGNKVLALGEGQLGKLYYEKFNTDPVITSYNTEKGKGALMYVGYEKPELFNVFVTMLSEGNVNTEITKNSEGKEIGKGFAGVVDFDITPFGIFTDEDVPITFGVSGNAIGGFNFNTGNNALQSVGFGLKGEAGFWLKDNYVVSPVVAFDGKLNSSDEFFWKMGGGLTFRFSGMRWVTTGEDWGDLYGGRSSYSRNDNAGNDPFADHRYENNKVLKFAYAQVYGAYSERTDFNLLFRAEEPDGELGFHEKLGAMMEMRLYNLAKKITKVGGQPNITKWETQARVSWDFNVKSFRLTPYLRGYLNNDSVVKLRAGAYANLIPFTCFELAYTSANLNKNVDLPKPDYLNSSYEKFFDAGRVELIIMLKSDDIRPQVPKRMSDWNYPTYVQHN
jgi:hypothetical protein